MTPDRTDLTQELTISRVLTGLWQVADQEKKGQTSDLTAAVDALQDYAKAGFDTFDTADHYGSAELIAGEVLKREPEARAFTKWCPEPGQMSRAGRYSGAFGSPRGAVYRPAAVPLVEL